jgi:hypothetical protein
MGSAEGAALTYDSRSKSQNYHDNMSSTNYGRRLIYKLIPNIPAGSTVVLSNVSCHTVQENKTPNDTSHKAEIQY